MGLRGKLIAKTEVKCGGELFHDHFSSKPHHIPNISPDKVHNFDIHEGELGTVGSVVSWKFTLGKHLLLFFLLSFFGTSNIMHSSMVRFDQGSNHGTVIVAADLGFLKYGCTNKIK